MRILLAAAALLFASGCGSEETPPEQPSDGKIRPPPSGERMTEAAACAALSDAHLDKLLAVGCAGTSRTCPTLLRSQSGTECVEYDKGSLDGCVAHIDAQATCSEVAASIDDCIVYAYADSAPAGCP
ncbi:MAG: hypothetical protein IPM54_27320 [Polyangiaceae bacterium]|nr:hypothetical protein [Polyangiaceae bacterium]